MSRPLHTIMLMSLLFAAASCSDHTLPVPDAAPIEFGLSFTAEARGSELTTDNISSFGVFAALEDDVLDGFDDIDASELELFMDDVPVRKIDGSWSATPPHYWPILDDKSLSFFAYAPYSAGTGIVAKAGWGGQDNQTAAAKTVKIEYTLDSNPSRHVDLCVAKAVLDRVPDMDDDGEADPVSFDFKHTLASISFAANYKGEVPDGCYLRVDELSLNNVVNSNTLTCNHSSDAFVGWDAITSGTPRNGHYLLNIGSLTLASNLPLNQSVQSGDEDAYTDIVTSNGVIYALPQQINPAGTSVVTNIDVTFSYVKQDAANTVIAQFYTSIDLPSSEWEMSRKYQYQFTLDITTASLINISCVDGGAWVEDWKDSGNKHTDTTIK